jgi:predicted MFS family arabinose efflux permease
VVFLVRVVGLSPAAVGLLLALGGIGGMAGAVVAGGVMARLGTACALLVGALGSGLFGLLIPATGPGALVAFFIIGSGVEATGIIIGNIIAASFRQTRCPPSMLGRATTTMRFLGFGGIPPGALAAGGLATALGVRTALWIILAVNARTGTLLLTPPLRSRRNLPAEPGG